MTDRTRESGEIVEIECEVKHQTELAWRVRVGGQVVWLPKSECEIDFQGRAGRDFFGETGAAVALVPEWLATEKDLV